MFRPMRRKKKEITAEAVKMLLASERRGVLAVNGDEGYPYAVPINYRYDEAKNCIIFHGAKTGHKFDAIRGDDRVCFTVYGNEEIREETWAPYLQSVVLFGRCRMIADEAEACALVKQLAEKYYPNEELIDECIAESGKAMQMFVIEIEHMTGKYIQEK